MHRRRGDATRRERESCTYALPLSLARARARCLSPLCAFSLSPAPSAALACALTRVRLRVRMHQQHAAYVLGTARENSRGGPWHRRGKPNPRHVRERVALCPSTDTQLYSHFGLLQRDATSTPRDIRAHGTPSERIFLSVRQRFTSRESKRLCSSRHIYTHARNTYDSVSMFVYRARALPH